MKRSFTANTRQGRALLLAATWSMAFGTAACGGVTKFKDTTPISIKGPEPVTAEVPPPPPAEKKKRVEVKQDRLEITEKIQFDLNAATIKPESDDLLGEIVAVLQEHPEIKKVDIIGHTSDEGADTYNQTLSENRAKAVLDYLAAHGVEGARLSSKGMGESVPLADNKTEDGRELNRRVEFLIVEQSNPSSEKKAEKKEKAEKKGKEKADTDKAEKKGKDKADTDKAEKKGKEKAEKKAGVEKKEKAVKGETL